MKKKIRLSVLLALILALILTTVVSISAYDTASDPLITYSGLVKWAEETFRPSLNTKIESSTAALQTALSDTQAKLATAEQSIATLEQKVADLSTKLENTSDASGSGYSVIFLTGGTQLLATSVCSIILRAGTAEVISPFAGQGLTDITSGLELNNGDSLVVNHQTIVPRGNDGRGIRITSAGGAYILVQGGYTLVEPQN
ncbi:MAG: hypothetical protein IJC15_01025 [Clostridia bacterium]|nr:hypothetical protein [Clostridia bacterium]